ncbi:MAG: 23S rRNA (guanosine(2251)-2'-O)-methyltransferase RlmB [Anaerolineaceae bacterium]
MREWIVGRNPVYEVIRAHRRQVFRLVIATGVQVSGRLQEILNLAKIRRINVEQVQRNMLDKLDEHHQGVGVEVSGYPYLEIADIMQNVEKDQGSPLVLILDMIQNPQNLGTLLRSAEAIGVQGVVMPLARTAGVTPAVVHASSGASEHLTLAQANLVQAINTLKEAGLWIFGLEAGERSQSIETVDLTIPLAWVVGNEGEGMRELVKKNCDVMVSLPMNGKVDSFNAAVAGSIALFQTNIMRRMKENNSTK